MRIGSFSSDALNEAAVPSKPACKLAGMWRSAWTFSTALMASPNEARGARLKETVMAGNWPWWLIERSSVVLEK